MSQGFTTPIPIPLPVTMGGSGQVAETGSGLPVHEDQPNLNQPTIAGVTDGSSAAAGDVGQFVISNIGVGSAVSLTTGTPANVTSISLDAGDWMIFSNVAFTVANTTIVTQMIGCPNTTSATLVGRGLTGSMTASTFTGDGAKIPSVSPSVQIVSISAPATIYLVAQATFTVSTCAAYGIVFARRAR